MAPSKRQTTMAKIAREQAVKERRARKQQKRDDKKRAHGEPEVVADSALSAQGLNDETPGAERTSLRTPNLT
jgi:hypothetical protein